MRAQFEIKEANIEVLASKIRVPTLLIHSQSDDQTSSWQSVDINKKLYQNYSIFHHTQWGSRHCKDMTNHPQKYEALIDDFFCKENPEMALPEKIYPWFQLLPSESS